MFTSKKYHNFECFAVFCNDLIKYCKVLICLDGLITKSLSKYYKRLFIYKGKLKKKLYQIKSKARRPLHKLEKVKTEHNLNAFPASFVLPFKIGTYYCASEKNCLKLLCIDRLFLIHFKLYRYPFLSLYKLR